MDLISRNHSISTEAFDIADTSDPLFHVCWRRQSCSSCLAGDVACSWCAISSVCVPNPAHLPILAPMRNAQICPLASTERWELRALPFGCNVSTLTFVSVLGTVIGIIVLGVIVALGLWIVKSIRRRWKESHYERLDEESTFTWRNFLNFGLCAPSSGSISCEVEHHAEFRDQDTSEDNERLSIGETRLLLRRT